MWKSLIIAILAFTAVDLKGQEDMDIKLANEYYNKGETEKARSLYEKIAEDPSRINLIHNNYYFLLLNSGKFEAAEKYISRVIKRFPNNLYYRLDFGLLYREMNEDRKADQYFRKMIDEFAQNAYLVRHAASYFVNNQLTEYAILAFEKSRDELQDGGLYALEMANVYRIKNEKEAMVREYLNYITTNPSNIRYVKNSLQNLLTETEELETLETLLYDRIQERPGNMIYPDLLIWVNLQLKNFYGAFLQARAMDLRLGTDGDRSYDIGMIALDNGDFETAERIFSWIIDSFPGTANYIRSRMHLVEAYEMKVKNTYPISDEEIRSVIADYEKFIREVGLDQNTLEALRNQALLYAFYLDELDTAIHILNQIIEIPGASRSIRAQSKLDLGDIYLLDGQPWESTLLYSQVEKEMKESPAAYEAKLRNARLSYFQGDFLLAQDHLDIIKKATTREISNDAMYLSVLIKDNISMDTTEAAMRAYADIELLLFQNKDSIALEKLKYLKAEIGDHPLQDELMKLHADILLEKGEFRQSADLLTSLVENFPKDILSDDAYFLLGEIYERHLDDPEKASAVYLDFLSKYPGSVYAAEARKRFRTLRGDFENLEMQ